MTALIKTYFCILHVALFIAGWTFLGLLGGGVIRRIFLPALLLAQPRDGRVLFPRKVVALKNI